MRLFGPMPHATFRSPAAMQPASASRRVCGVVCEQSATPAAAAAALHARRIVTDRLLSVVRCHVSFGIRERVLVNGSAVHSP